MVLLQNATNGWLTTPVVASLPYIAGEAAATLSGGTWTHGTSPDGRRKIICIRITFPSTVHLTQIVLVASNTSGWTFKYNTTGDAYNVIGGTALTGVSSAGWDAPGGVPVAMTNLVVVRTTVDVPGGFTLSSERVIGLDHENPLGTDNCGL